MAKKGVYKRSLLIIIGDLFIVPFSYVAGYYLRFGTLSGFGEKLPWLFLILMTLSYLAIFYFFDLYELKKNYFTITSFVGIFLSVLVAAVLISFLKYGLFLFPIGRGIFILANLIILVSSFFWRGLCYQLFKYIIKPKRLIIIGAGKAGMEIAKVIGSTVDDFEVLGFLDDDERKKGKLVAGLNLKVLDSINKIPSLIENYKIDQIILANPEQENPQLTKNLLEARLKGIEVIDMPEIYQLLKGKIPINYIQENWLLKEKGFDLSNKKFMMKIKRLIDIIVSSLILLISLPLWPIIALLIKINSRGSVIYSQQRVGKNESIFSLYKFRSMIDKAEKDRPLWADEDDQRITFVGKILRKLHMDELPQIWNIIKGDMSLVGPRPERPEFVEKLNKKIPYYSFRHFTMPGLTGWAQVNYPYASSMKDSRKKFEYDLYYISHMNLLLDLRILLETAKAILLGRQRKR